MSKTLTYANLPVIPNPRVVLWCASCGGEWSATRGDYFTLGLTDPLTCGEDCVDDVGLPVALRLARRVTCHLPASLDYDAISGAVEALWMLHKEGLVR